ncbi:hypothetical protein D3C85_1202280 [compost metagenome]
MATSAAPMKAAQNPAWPRATLPAYWLSNAGAKAKIPNRNSRLAAHTAMRLTHSMKRKP